LPACDGPPAKAGGIKIPLSSGGGRRKRFSKGVGRGMNVRTELYLQLAAIPAVGATLLDPRPAFVLAGDGAGILFVNAAGTGFLGAANIDAVLDRRFAHESRLMRQVGRLIKTLPVEIYALEMLRFDLGETSFSVAAQCRRIEAGTRRAVLALLATGHARPSEAELAARLLTAAGDGRAMTILDADGKPVVGAPATEDSVRATASAMIDAAASAASGLARRTVEIAGSARDATLVEFDSGSRTLYLFVAEDRARNAAPASDTHATIERAPVAEEAAVAPAAPAARPQSPPLAFSEEDIDVAARKSIEEGNRIAGAKEAPPAPPTPAVPAKRAAAAPPAPAPTPPAAMPAAAMPAAARSNVVRLPGAPVRAFPPERLTGNEQDAFRRIAEALGVRMPEPFRREDAEAPASPIPTVAVQSTLLDKLPVGIIVYSERQTLYANKSALDLLLYPSFADLTAAGGADAVFPEGAAAKPAKGGRGEINVRRKDGTSVPIEARLHGISWGETPAVMLTLLRRTEARPDPLPDRAFMADLAAAGDRAEELEAILDTATDGIIVIDKAGRIERLNKSAEALFGIEARDVAGTEFTGLFAEESRKAALDYLDGLAANGVASVLNDGREVIGKVAGRGLIPLFMTMGRISGGDKFCAVLRDITYWKNVEEELVAAKRAAETANAQKSEFLAKVSHEIRTPLNAIIGFSEVMMEERFGPIGSERYREYLRDIHVSGGHLLSLINDLLDLSKIEAGKVELAFQAVALNELIQETVALMQPQANRQRIIIRTSLAAGVPNVVADQRSLRQILLNLLSNAIKFTGPGGQVIVATTLEESGEVEVRIRDTGVGMSAKDLETAMMPFRQVGSAQARGDGTGLGLPLTKALVEANRAVFSLTSAPNQGTLARITFPTTRVLAG